MSPKAVLLLTGAGLALAFGGLAVWKGPDAYRSWKHDRFVSRARVALDDGDARAASMHLRKALLAEPDNVESARLMAQLAGEARSPQAVGWWERIAELEPGVSSNYVTWADVALQYGHVDAAAKALQLAGDSGAEGSDYHMAAARVAAARKDHERAISELQAAVRQSPTNETLRFRLAAVLLDSTNVTHRAEGEHRISEFLAHETLRQAALRQLAASAIAQGRHADALQHTTQLVAITNAPFGDHLLHLQTLHLNRDTDESAQFERTAAFATSDPGAAVAVGRWLGQTKQPQRALDWMNQQAPSVRTNLPGAIIVVDALTELGHWTAVPDFLEAQSWGTLEAMRHAVVARAFRELDRSQAFKGAWSRALRAAAQSREALVRLAQTVVAWRWAEETEEVLWEIVTRHPAEKWAFERLSLMLYVSGKTRGLNSLLEKLAEIEPDNLAIRNNLAMTKLLLTPEDPTAGLLARTCYEGDPKNPHFVSTYAFALSRAGQTQEALKLFEQLPDDSLRDTTRVYRGLVLAEAGRTAEAREWLQGWEKTRLLPEEVNLVKKAL